MDVTSTLTGDLLDRSLKQIVPHVVGFGSSVRVHHYLYAPGAVTTAHLCVADERTSAALAGHETGESRAPPVDEVEPLVLSERTVLIGAGRGVEEQ
jgi:hypothetical protein